MKRFIKVGALVILIAILLTACGSTEEPELMKKIINEEGITYNISRTAMQKLDLPEPGIDTSNKMKVIDYPEQEMLEILIGPHDIPAGANHKWYPPMLTSMPFKFWIKSYDWQVTDKNKRDLGVNVLHHVNIIDPSKRELFYPIARRLFAASDDTPGGKLPIFTGVPVEPDSPLLIGLMYQNATDTTLKDVYLRVIFSYEKEGGFFDPIDLYPLYLDAGGPLLPRDFSVPPGKSVHAYSSQPATQGRLIALGSHMHNYGKTLLFIDSTDNDTIWETHPTSTKKGYVTKSSNEIFFPFGEKLKTNHVYRVAAIYNNPLDKPSPDMGMGTIGGLFRPTGDDDDWSKPDYDNKTYLEDLRLTLGVPVLENWHDMSTEEMEEHVGENIKK